MRQPTDVSYVSMTEIIYTVCHKKYNPKRCVADYLYFSKMQYD